MEPTELVLMVMSFLGATQIIKDNAVLKRRLMPVVCVAFGGLAVYMKTYHADLWESLTPLLLAIAGTGGYSILDEFRKKMKK